MTYHIMADDLALFVALIRNGGIIESIKIDNHGEYDATVVWRTEQWKLDFERKWQTTHYRSTHTVFIHRQGD